MSHKISNYEIYENLYGEFRILDLDNDELVTTGGSPLFCDSLEEAIEFLQDNKLI